MAKFKVGDIVQWSNPIAPDGPSRSDVGIVKGLVAQGNICVYWFGEGHACHSDPEYMSLASNVPMEPHEPAA